MSTKPPKQQTERQRSTYRVYSSDVGRTCPGCLRAKSACVCRATHGTLAATSGDGIVRLYRQTKGRSGKTITLINGLVLTKLELTTLAKSLKASCGVGGSIKSGVIELQTGDREKIQRLLEAAGFKVKIAGG